MNKIHKTISSKDTQVQVVHEINNIELENWINHLLNVKKELEVFNDYYKSLAVDKKIEIEKTILNFEIKKIDNDVFLKALIDYKNTRINLDKCEDTSCNMNFLGKHEECRRMFLFHIEKYRKLKDAFFNELQEKIIISKISA
ncbi:hypothetical protein U8527_07330 [Kordia algicida OT-1]|uniref:Uncharacterized protein n=1 Tax=Kordia algicida OT-1 TaxID=391587 RepID=A9EDF0_9FLAO|nr:hypothetical protein [Kordia algicida]EDP94222.1 hypothetical protein KAOT1_00740 [Kordia algicida OT-1]